MTTFLPGQTAVLRIDHVDNDFFYLNYDDSDDIVKLKKLRFQTLEQYTPGATLKCKVRSVGNDGRPEFEHYIPQYVKRFYFEKYNNRIASYFTVEGVPSNPGDPIVMSDDYGILYRVHDPNAIVSQGQKLKCEFVTLNDNKFELRCIDEGRALWFISPETLFEAVSMRPMIANILFSTLSKKPYMADSLSRLHDKDPLWIISALNAVQQRLVQWYVDIDARRRPLLADYFIEKYRQVGLYLIEGSNFMSNLADKPRDNMRLRLTRIVESAEPLLLAHSVITEGRSNAFVNGILDNLSKSGYLYHPTQQLSALMILFRLDPEMINSSLKTLFDVIMSRDISNWDVEPFRSAFVDQFEVYISQARRAIDSMPMAEDTDERQSIQNTVTAIALQLLLADPELFPAYPRNSSLLYRYISLLQPIKANELLLKSLITALDINLPLNFEYKTVKTPMMMMTAASVMPHNGSLEALGARYSFRSQRMEFSVSPSGLSIASTNSDIHQQVIPQGMMEWGKTSIFTDPIAAPKSNSIEAHHAWWREIERSLTSEVVHTQTDLHIPAAGKDENVLIVINYVIPGDNGNPLMQCTICDPNFKPSRGLLSRDDIVGYKVGYISPDLFISPMGAPYTFDAKVKYIDSDGIYHFSLKENFQDLLHSDILNYEDTYKGVITGITQRGYSALSESGFGLYLELESDEPSYHVGEKVAFKIREKSDDNIVGYITGDLDIDMNIDKNSAFANVLRQIRIDPEPTDIVEQIAEEETAKLDEIPLSTEDMAEIIDILRFRAQSARNIVETFDYLNFARLLALIIDDQAMVESLQTHAQVLRLFEYFATNNRIEAEQIAELEAQCPDDSVQQRLLLRLKMLSLLGHDIEPTLRRFADDDKHHIEQQLARFVKAYNFLKLNGEDNEQVFESILKSIKRLLNIDHDSTLLKYYGTESRFVEFKSSTVFAAGSDVPDPAKQQQVILKVIASFMNAGGGILYIGVNDKHHFECGLHDDFEYYKKHKVRIGPYENKVKNLDNLCNELSNLMNYTFTDSICRLIDISIDEDASKDVIIIKVSESLEPVYLDGNLYERRDASVRHISDPEEISRFIVERKALRDANLHQTRQAHAENVVTSPVIVEHKKEAKPKPSEPKPKKTESLNEAANVATCSWRTNIMHDYEPDYVTPLARIYLTNSGQLIASGDDRYLENESLMALTVLTDDAQGWLLLVYNGQKALRIPISLLVDNLDGDELPLADPGNIAYAAIVRPGDGLLSVVHDASSSLWQRVTPIELLSEGHPGDAPQPYIDHDLAGTYMLETVASSAMGQFSKSLSTALKSHQIGRPLSRKLGGAFTDDTMLELRRDCKPK